MIRAAAQPTHADRRRPSIGRQEAARRLPPIRRRAALLLLLAACGGPAPEGGKRTVVGPPHAILLLTLDTTRADHLSVYGYGRDTTPALARLASGCASFDQAISQMPSTDPSHLTMLTGLYPRSHGVLRNGVPLLDPSLPNLATWARELGYQTAAFVSRAHVDPPALALQGFEHTDGPPGHSRRGARTLAKALAWLAQHGDRPFFLWVHLFDPHYPYQAPPPFDQRFADPAAPLRPLPPGRQPPRRLTPGLADSLIRRYDGELAYTDTVLERLFRAVDEASSGDVLAIVAGDHGEAMDEVYDRTGYAFDHGRLLNQGALRVPLLLCRSGVIPAARIDAKVEMVDLAPTLFDLVGGGFPAQGHSLAPLLELSGGSSGQPPSGLAFSQRRFRPRLPLLLAVQDSRYKLIVSRPGESRLYDLIADPEERVDLQQSEPAVARRLERELRAWLRDTPQAAGGDREVEADRVEALRSLGYVD